MKTKLEELCDLWTERERGFREHVAKLPSPEAYGRFTARADAVAMCRRELQEAAGLIVKGEE